MNKQKIETIKTQCGFLLVQTPEQSILKDTSFFLSSQQETIKDLNNKKNGGKVISREVYNLSQSCFLLLTNNGEVYVVSSGLIFFNFLNEQARGQLERDFVLDLTQLEFNAQFNLSLENYKTQFLELIPFRLFLDEDILEFFYQIKRKSFAYKSAAQINFSFDDHILRNTSVLFFQIKGTEVKHELIKHLSNISLPFSSTLPTQGDHITTISSPFGLLSSQLYHNIIGQGVIANVFKMEASSKFKRLYKHILMLDITNYGGKEGGLVLDTESNVLGMILPSFGFLGANSTYFSFAISANIIQQLADSNLDLIYHNPFSKEITESNSFINNICLLQTSQGHFTGIILNQDGFILSVRHGVEQLNKDTPINMYVIGQTNAIAVELVCMSKGDYDVSLLRARKDITYLNIKPMKLYQSQLSEGMEVMSIGYGLVHPSKLPQISRGIISKIVSSIAGDQVLVQSNTRIQNGCSGGALICKSTHSLIGIIMFNLKHVEYGNICDLNFSLHYSILAPLFEVLHSRSDIQQIQALSLWTYKNDEIKKLYTLQTVEKVPQYKLKPLL